MTPATARARDRLLGLADAHGLGRARDALDALGGPLGDVLADVDRTLDALAPGPGLHRSAARHLIAGGGKRVRPALCALAAMAAGGADRDRVRALGAAAEAIHAATLLHDDVIDQGEVRRGLPAARVVFGNAASVLAGDLLLVRALELVEDAAVPGLGAAVLAVLGRMIDAEALQLARRGSAALTLEEYHAIVGGKTAALFEWAALAGARLAGGGDARAAALARFGFEIGMAYQVMDDVLDFTADPAAFGKALLTDVREGTVTFPLVFALRADPGLAPALERAASGADGAGDGLAERARRAAHAAGAFPAARAEVHGRTAAAVAALAPIAPGPPRDLLVALAEALADRHA